MWDPYLAKDVELLEKTQKFGLRVCLKNWSSDYNALLSQANIPALTTRCSQARLSHLFKIMHDQTDFPHAPIVQRSFHYNSRFDNSMAIRPFKSHTTQFLNSFFPRTASQWNSLPATVVSHSSTLASFQIFYHQFNLGLHVSLLALGYSCISTVSGMLCIQKVLWTKKSSWICIHKLASTH